MAGQFDKIRRYLQSKPKNIPSTEHRWLQKILHNLDYNEELELYGDKANDPNSAYYNQFLQLTSPDNVLRNIDVLVCTLNVAKAELVYKLGDAEGPPITASQAVHKLWTACKEKKLLSRDDYQAIVTVYDEAIECLVSSKKEINITATALEEKSVERDARKVWDGI